MSQQDSRFARRNFLQSEVKPGLTRKNVIHSAQPESLALALEGNRTVAQHRDVVRLQDIDNMGWVTVNVVVAEDASIPEGACIFANNCAHGSIALAA